MNIKDEYKKIRSNYLRSVNNAVKKYGVNKDKYKINIPKKITKSSISNIEKHKKRLEREIREIKIETGYYTKRRKQRRSNNVKQKTTQPTPPNLSDIVLERFEQEMKAAETYVHPKGNKKWQDAVREAGYDADDDFSEGINEWISRNFKKETIRNEVSKNLYRNFYINYDNLEKFLYDFESDFNGNLVHVEGRQPLDQLLEVAFNIKITDDMIEERDFLNNEIGDGEDILSDILEVL